MLQALRTATLLKRDSNIGVFLQNLRDFYENLFLQNNSSGCFCCKQFIIFNSLRYQSRDVYILIRFLSGGIGAKILEVVDWPQVSNQASHLESAAATRISRSQRFEASSSFLKLLQASLRFLKQQAEPDSVVTKIRRKTNHEMMYFAEQILKFT